MNSCSFSSPGYKTIAAKSTHIDSSQFSISEQTGAALSFYAKDTIMVTRSSLLGTTWNGYFGPCSPPSHTNLFLTARDIILDRFLVYNNSTNIRNHIRELDIRYCIFDKYLSVERYYADDSSFNISHSNISGLNYRTGNIGNDNISNNIIRQIWFFNNASDTLYVSPFSYNIIDSLPYGTPYFGFLKNIQRNIKGDSCDLWFNQKVDPQIVDESNGTLAITSPALGAASDGTNIGYYQGAGVGVIAMDPYRNRREEPCLFRSIPGRYNSAINVQFVLPEPGKVDFRILTLFGQTVKIVSANFPNAGKHELLVNSGNLTAGMYVCKLEAAELTSIRRLVVLK
jgi:hypothetical protein